MENKDDNKDEKVNEEQTKTIQTIKLITWSVITMLISIIMISVTLEDSGYTNDSIMSYITIGSLIGYISRMILNIIEKDNNND